MITMPPNEAFLDAWGYGTPCPPEKGLVNAFQGGTFRWIGSDGRKHLAYRHINTFVTSHVWQIHASDYSGVLITSYTKNTSSVLCLADRVYHTDSWVHEKSTGSSLFAEIYHEIITGKQREPLPPRLRFPKKFQGEENALDSGVGAVLTEHGAPGGAVPVP